jgi:NAD(P)-dependent dehydrogenase (short-subunit alcohol dehydrogenase family)
MQWPSSSLCTPQVLRRGPSRRARKVALSFPGTARGRFVALDVLDDASVNAARETIAAAGGLDVLVNNAGILGSTSPVAETTVEDLRHVYETNVFGVVRVSQAFLPLLEASAAPVVVNVSSGMGSLGRTTDPDRVESKIVGLPYTSSKSALNMLTSQYAKAYPPSARAPSPGEPPRRRSYFDVPCWTKYER